MLFIYQVLDFPHSTSSRLRFPSLNVSRPTSRVLRPSSHVLVPIPSCHSLNHYLKRPRSIYQYSHMASRLSGQTVIFGAVFFALKSLLGIVRQRALTILTRTPRGHVGILIYQSGPSLLVTINTTYLLLVYTVTPSKLKILSIQKFKSRIWYI